MVSTKVAVWARIVRVGTEPQTGARLQYMIVLGAGCAFLSCGRVGQSTCLGEAGVATAFWAAALRDDLPLAPTPWADEDEDVALFTVDDEEDAAASWSLEDLPRVRTLAVFLVVCLVLVAPLAVDTELAVACGEGDWGTSLGDTRPSSGTFARFLPEERCVEDASMLWSREKEERETRSLTPRRF